MFEFYNAADADGDLGTVHQCKVCGQYYQSRSWLRRHKRFDCGPRPVFQCIFCLKPFLVKSTLTIHARNCKRRERNDNDVLINIEK